MQWKQALSDEAASDFDALLDRLMPLAQERLEKEGVCWPVAAAFDRKGVATELVEDASGPRSVRDQLDNVYDTLRDRKDWLRSVGIAADVRAVGIDSLRITLEHHGGEVVDVFLTYSRTKWRNKVQYGDLRMTTGHRGVWDPGYEPGVDQYPGL